MTDRSSAEAWQTLVNVARRDGTTVFTVSQGVPSALSYDPSVDAVRLISQHHAASGEPFELDRPTFERIWRRLQRGEVLSRPGEPAYTDLAALLDDDRRASGVMGLLDTVFETVESDTGPVRVWLER